MKSKREKLTMRPEGEIILYDIESISQNPQNFTAQRVNFNVHKCLGFFNHLGIQDGMQNVTF